MFVVSVSQSERIVRFEDDRRRPLAPFGAGGVVVERIQGNPRRRVIDRNELEGSRKPEKTKRAIFSMALSGNKRSCCLVQMCGGPISLDAAIIRVVEEVN